MDDFVGDWSPGEAKIWWLRSMSAENVNNAALDWLDSREDSAPVFAYLHYIDVHEMVESIRYSSKLRFSKLGFSRSPANLRASFQAAGRKFGDAIPNSFLSIISMH